MKAYEGLENLEVESMGAVLLVRVARPKAMNALSSATLTEIGQVFTVLDTDDDHRAAVLTGGDTGKAPAFVAGADIREMSEMSGMELREYSRLGQVAFNAIERNKKPVIAAINGFALGGGLELAMACHLRFASDGARMGQPEVDLGIIPGFAGTQRLPRLVGRSCALEILLGGKHFKADRALEIGLVDRVIAADALLEDTLKYAEELSKKAPLAVRLIIDAVTRGQDMSFDEAGRLESDLFGVAGATADVKEGFSAFIEKRAPNYEGR